MNILFITPQLPWPPTQGAAIRNYHLISGLAQQHRVSLLTFAPAEAAPDARQLEYVHLVPPPQRRTADRLHTLLLTPLPDMARRLYSPALLTALRQTLRERPYDWVVIEGIEMAPYAREVLRLGRQRPRWLFDEHNAEFALQRSAFWSDLRGLPRPRAAAGATYSLAQWLRLRRYERAACRAADAVVAVSAEDRQELLTLDRRLEIGVVPNGVDLAYWSPQAVQAEAAAIRQQHTPLLVFDGSMDFRPNVDAVSWFCAAIWPQIRAQLPAATFAIVGRNPAPTVQALAATPGVVVTGLVPATRPWVAASDVYVVPMRMGGGVRLKVLQAMALGRPLVSTPLGMQGVAAVAGRDFLAAADPAAFAAAALDVLRDAELGGKLGRAANLAAQPYSWSAIVPRFAERMVGRS